MQRLSQEQLIELGRYLFDVDSRGRVLEAAEQDVDEAWERYASAVEARNHLAESYSLSVRTLHRLVRSIQNAINDLGSDDRRSRWSERFNSLLGVPEAKSWSNLKGPHPFSELIDLTEVRIPVSPEDQAEAGELREQTLRLAAP